MGPVKSLCGSAQFGCALVCIPLGGAAAQTYDEERKVELCFRNLVLIGKHP
jgi:hypothetical protein